MESILLNIAKLSPIIGVLLYALYWFNNQYNAKNKEIVGLNKLLRDSEKENLVALYKVLSFMEKMEEKDESKHKMLLKEIQEMRTSIETKISSYN